MIDYPDIFNLLFTAVEAFAGSTYDVVYPGIEDTSGVKHLRVNVLLAEPLAVGIKSTDEVAGICQVDCCTTTNEGAIVGLDLATEVQAAFPRNTNLQTGLTIVRIDGPAAIKQGFLANDGSKWITPVSIPFKVIR